MLLDWYMQSIIDQTTRNDFKQNQISQVATFFTWPIFANPKH